MKTKEFMKTDLEVLPRDASFDQVLQVITSSDDAEFPVVDNTGTWTDAVPGRGV